MSFAQVAVNIPTLTGIFDYHLPAELAGKVGAGHLVLVPFGKQTVQGVVVGLTDQPSVPETKPILSLVDHDRVLTLTQIEFAKQLAAQTLNPLAAMIDLMLPNGLSQQADVLYQLTVDGRPETEARPPSTVNGQSSTVQSRIINLLTERGGLRGRQIDHHFKNVDWRKSAQVLIKQGAIVSQSILPPPSVRPKYIRTAQLSVVPQIAQAAMLMPDLGKTEDVRERRKKALAYLIQQPELISVTWVYAESGCNAADLESLHERGLISLHETEIFRDPLQKINPDELKKYKEWAVFTEDQQNAWIQIESAFKERSEGKVTPPFLLHGVTGSGKTEIYLRAAAETIKRNKQVIILLPEIALTPQIVRRFMARFPGQVGLVHSKLSEGERYDTWRRARNGLIKIIIGARSALFMPLPKIGLIVADECHDSSYYQSEPPFYHAISAALTLGEISGAVTLLGSATPPVALRYQASGGGMRLLELPRRIVTSEVDSAFGELPPVSIVDMREELKAGNRGIFSRALVDALGETLKRNEQAILFLNRRGTATYVFCRDCGYVLKCPHCDTPLTHHILTLEHPNVGTLLCHRCGYKRQMPKTCPQCSGNQIREYGLGSEKVEKEIQTLFPQARVLRWDWDTTRKKDAHEIILNHFVNHRADVLVGTQMLAKGLDLPLVTLVGIVLADVGLNLPDPFTYERAFQTLTQVAGRAGRSSRGGEVILQTFMPEHEIIQSAAKHDYAGFYEKEIENRRKLGYAPFAKLVRLEYRHRDALEAENAAQKMAGVLKQKIENESLVETEIIGPAPSFFSKFDDMFRWQIILRGANPEKLISAKMPEGWRVEVGPGSIL